jgi:hypothetical protein
MKRRKKASIKKQMSRSSSPNRPAKQDKDQRKKRLVAAQKRVRQIERWHKILAPKFPDIDPHDLDLIIAGLLKTPKERTQVLFLKKREDGRYVF